MAHNMKNLRKHIIIIAVGCIFGAQAFGQSPSMSSSTIPVSKIKQGHTPVVASKKIGPTNSNNQSNSVFSQTAKLQPVAQIEPMQVRSRTPIEESSLKITIIQNSEVIEPIKNTKNEVTIKPSKKKVNGYPKINTKSNQF